VCICVRKRGGSVCRSKGLCVVDVRGMRMHVRGVHRCERDACMGVWGVCERGVCMCDNGYV